MAVMYYLMSVILVTATVSGMSDMRAEETEPVEPAPEMPVTSKNIQALYPIVEKMLNAGFLCEACESAVSFLKNATEDEKNLKELVALLLPYCDFAPFIYHSDCIALVNDIPAMVNEWANKFLDPKKDCAVFCAGPAPEIAPMNDITLKMLQLVKARKPIN